MGASDFKMPSSFAHMSHFYWLRKSVSKTWHLYISEWAFNILACIGSPVPHVLTCWMRQCALRWNMGSQGHLRSKVAKWGGGWGMSLLWWLQISFNFLIHTLIYMSPEYAHHNPHIHCHFSKVVYPPLTITIRGAKNIEVSFGSSLSWTLWSLRSLDPPAMWVMNLPLFSTPICHQVCPLKCITLIERSLSFQSLAASFPVKTLQRSLISFKISVVGIGVWPPDHLLLLPLTAPEGGPSLRMLGVQDIQFENHLIIEWKVLSMQRKLFKPWP